MTSESATSDQPSQLDADSTASLRRGVYWLLIITSGAAMTGQIFSVRASTGETPMLSANDRSRWCTVHSLVDRGTFAIDDIIQRRHPESRRRYWYTIDMVRHRGTDGREHYYSSKPPLFPIILAGEYWLIQRFTGSSLVEQPFFFVRALLITTNVLPLLIYFVLLARLIERYGTTDWGRIFAMTAATWGTFLTTFAVTINNHLPAAISVLITVHAVLPIWYDGSRRWRHFVIAGLFAAFAAANELPALSFLTFIGAALLWRAPRQTLIAFVPAVAVVAVAFFGTTYWAHQSWRPPYAHRSDGQVLFTAKDAPEILPALKDGNLPAALQQDAEGLEALGGEATEIAPGGDGRWVAWHVPTQQRFAILQTAGGWEVRAWDNWYEYEKSYWTPKNRSGVDRGEPSRLAYAFHATLGHHGVVSLTPVWLLSLIGICIMLASSRSHLREFALLVALLTIVCMTFYIMRPLQDRNYGGVCCGFRWMFWFTPLWLVCLLPAVDKLQRYRLGRVIALACLAVSVISASYGSANPWSHPWLYDYWQYLGYIAK